MRSGRNSLITSSIPLFASCSSTGSDPEIQSSSSVKETATTGFLFFAETYSYFFNARFLVILQMKALSDTGRCGGMAFHTPRYVSLTHSSESSREDKIFIASRMQSLPYFSRMIYHHNDMVKKGSFYKRSFMVWSIDLSIIARSVFYKKRGNDRSKTSYFHMLPPQGRHHSEYKT